VTLDTQAAPQVLPVPDDFPVRFAPGDEQVLWERDRMHFPGQVTALEAELVSEAVGPAFGHAARLYSLPVGDLRTRTEHGYAYTATVPLPVPPGELEELGRRSEAVLGAAVARLGELWDEQILPEIREHLDAMAAADLDAASPAELAAALDATLARATRLWELHFEIVFPAYLAVSEFDELFRDLFGGEAFDAYRLLEGIETKTFEVGRDLWRLSRVALASAEVTRVLEREAAAAVPGRLAASEDGRAFLTELDAHLEAYGQRSATWGISTPTFAEDPAPVVKMLKDYLGRPDSADPGLALRRLAAERETAIAEARERLAGYPAPVVEQFEGLLRAGQVGLRLTEDHGFYIDAWGLALVRRAVMAAGRRLAAGGAIDAPEDVLHLTATELRATVAADPMPDRRAVVAERRADLERYADVAPPFRLGTMPAGPPPPDGPASRVSAKFAGLPPTVQDEPGVLRGSAGSEGAVTGVARVVTSLDDAARLQPGEVLVAETTAPPWTPLFGVAGAVVTDTGGVLSHSAVVAREYGIPAVVGAGTATAAIADGTLVEVDGDAGTVRILG
jgi:pyruvate,water dikinase